MGEGSLELVSLGTMGAMIGVTVVLDETVCGMA
jgi:hypothetical protein